MLVPCWLLARREPTRFLSADAAQRASFQVVGDSLLDVRDQANLAAVMAFGVGALMYYSLLYHSQLVPRWLSGWGIVAIILTLVACLLALFGRHPVTTYVPLMLPIAVQEIVLAMWLIAKGFTPPGHLAMPLQDGTVTRTGVERLVASTPSHRASER